MKTMIEKIFSAQIFALMVAMCATGGVWAEGEPEILDDAYLWLDASTLTGSSGDEVSSWESRNAAGKTASTTGTKPTISSTQLDGKNVVDFGDPGSGMDLSFDRSTTIRTVFMVADVADNAKVFLLGDSSNYNFHRGTGKQYFYDYGTDALVSGTYRNGIKVDNPRGTTIPTGFGLITLAASADVAASRICQDRNESGRNGGKKIAELIIFNKTLTETERCQVEEYLMEKWLGYCYRKASVSADTTWSALVWDKAKPDSVPDSQCTYTVNITDNATLDLDGATIAAQSIIFDIASDKTLTLNGTATITGANISVTGSGKLKLNTSNPGCAITVASGATMDITTVESVTCAIYNYGVVNTDGTVSLSSGSNTFNYGSTLNVKTGTTTLSTSNQGLKGDIYILAPATLVNSTSDSLTYNASQSQPTHAYVYGTLTMNQKWTVAQYNYIHLYSGATLNGSGNLHFNKNTGTVIVEEDGDYTIAAPFNTDGGTAKVEVKGSATLTLSNTPNNLKIEKAGTGTLKWSNKVLRALSGTGGTIEIDASSGNLGHTFTSSTFDGVLKLTGTSKQNNLVGSGSTRCFADNVRPELIADAMETYLSKDAYNGQILYVRNLSGRSGAKLDARYTSGPISYTLDTLQERDTEYLGVFNNNSGDNRTFALNVTGNNVGGIHTLTLGGDNASTNTLTVSNYAKVKFSSDGKWSKGIVVVGNNGVLESQNSAAIAAKLKVEEGATLKFANGVPLAATAYDWSAISSEGSVNIDLSAVAPSTTPVTLIARDVDVTEDKFTVRGAKTSATLSVEDGALKVTFANIWRNGAWDGTLVAGDDAVFYLSQNSTLTVPEALSLGAVTVVKEGEGNVALTISGAGALTTEGWTIPEGVTVNTPASMSISGTVLGDGVLNIPANTTLAMDDVTCSTKVTVSGTLQTSGTTTLSGANTSAAGSLIEVVSDTTTLSSAFQGIGGNITIDAGAALTLGASLNGSKVDQLYNHINPNGSTILDISGTLNVGVYMLEFGSNIQVLLRTNARVTANTNVTGDNSALGYGHWAWLDSGMGLHAYGNAELALFIRTPSGVSPVFNIEEGATLVISQPFVSQTSVRDGGGSITKTGAGTLKFTQETLTKPMTISAGKVQLKRAFTSGLAISIAESAELELGVEQGNSDVTDKSFVNITGTGTIRYSSTATGYYTLPNSAANMFASTLSVINDNTHALIVTFNGSSPSVTTNRNMHGSGSYRSDWGSGTYRGLLALQDKNTEWSGTFWTSNDHRIKEFIVAGVDGVSQKTLTLSGTQVAAGSTPLTVESNGSANLTGSWFGNATVSGELGGTGTLTGTLTFNVGSTFKMWESGSLSVSGTLTLPESGKVHVDVSGISLSNDGTTIMTFGSVSGTIAAFSCDHAVLGFDGTSLKAYPAVASVTWGDGTVTCYTLLDTAVSAASADETHKYVTILANTSFVPVNGVKYKVADGVTATPESGSPEYGTPAASEADGNGAVTYNLKAVNNPTTYTWKSDATTNYWQLKGNWNNSTGATADRPLIPGDSVVIGVDRSSNPIQITSSVTINAISVGNTVALTASNTDKTLTVTEGVVLTTATSTLTISDKLSLDGDVTTTVADKCVKWVYGGNSKTYSVADPVAQIGDVKYGSLANAIEVATDAGLASITVTDSTAEVPAGYYLINEGSGIAKYQAATVDSSGNVLAYFTSLQNAVDALVTIPVPDYYASYDHFEVYYGTGVSLSVSPSVWSSVKIKCLDGSSVTVSSSSADCEFIGGNPDVNNVVTYAKEDKATTYVWVSATGSQWANLGKWHIGTSDGATASRAPSTNDSVILNDGATVLVGANNITVASIVINGVARITGNNGSVTSSSTIDLATASASLAYANITISPVPTTSVSGKAVRVGTIEDEPAYMVVSAGAMIGDVGYDTLGNAITAASNGDTITLAANCSENVNLGGKSITLNEGSYTFTGSFTGSGTLTLSSLLKSAATARWAEGWTGTVVLPAINSIAGNTFAFNNYGRTGSTVCVTTIGGGWLKNEKINPTIEIGTSLVLTDFSAGWNNTFTKITGSGLLSVSGSAASVDVNNEITDKGWNWYNGCSAYFLVNDISEFRGAITVSNVGIAIGDSKPQYQTPGGKIIIDSNKTATVGASKTWTATELQVNGTLNVLSGGTLSGNIVGNGTIVYDGAAPASALSFGTWTGTVELKNITTVITGFDFADYGNANSTVRANNVLVRMPETGGEYGNVGEINLVGEGLRFGGDPIAGQDFTFSAAISGTGKIRVGTRCETASPAHTRYIFKGDLSDFAGGVDYNETGWYKATIVFQAEPDVIPAGNNGEWGQIILTENTTISLGGEMYGPAGIIVAGSINVLAGGSVRVDSGSGQKIEGSGTITYTTFPSSAPAFNNSWAGEVHLPGNASIAGANFGNWGKSGSKIVLDGDMAGWIAQNTSVTAEMVLDSHNFTVNDFSPSSYSFSKISGSGNISFNHKENGYQPSSLTIGEIAPTYSGTVNNNTTATLNITTLALSGGATVTPGTKLLATGGSGTITVGAVTIGGAATTGLTWERRTSGEEGDGIYVAQQVTSTGEDASQVTTVATDKSTATVSLSSDYAGKVVIPPNVTSLTTGDWTVNTAKVGLSVAYTGGTDIYYDILKLDDGVLVLDDTKQVTISEKKIDVKPAVDTTSESSEPMSLGGDNKPGFTIKTIPGLYYAVKVCDTPTGTFTGGDAVQADSTSESVSAGTAFSGTVQYYKVAVGRTAAEAEE